MTFAGSGLLGSALEFMVMNFKQDHFSDSHYHPPTLTPAQFVDRVSNDSICLILYQSTGLIYLHQMPQLMEKKFK